jgi:phosphohistidine phosphatase
VAASWGEARVILYFLRHADAGQPRPHDDDARELSPKGEAAMHGAASVWRRLKVRPEVVISSPLPRALRTAELLVHGLGLKKRPTMDERLAPGAQWSDMAKAMAAHPKAERIAFVGHEPDLSRAVELLTGATGVRMRKGGLAAVEFSDSPEPGAGELAWLIDPDLYKLGADAAG